MNTKLTGMLDAFGVSYIFMRAVRLQHSFAFVVVQSIVFNERTGMVVKVSKK